MWSNSSQYSVGTARLHKSQPQRFPQQNKFSLCVTIQYCSLLARTGMTMNKTPVRARPGKPGVAKFWAGQPSQQRSTRWSACAATDRLLDPHFNPPFTFKTRRRPHTRTENPKTTSKILYFAPVNKVSQASASRHPPYLCTLSNGSILHCSSLGCCTCYPSSIFLLPFSYPILHIIHHPPNDKESPGSHR